MLSKTYRCSRIIIFTSLFLFCAHIASSQGQNPPFWNDIQAFKKKDSTDFPGTGKILFTGSSSFTLWKNVQDDFPAYPIINRGFGGSTLADLIRYAGDVIYPYAPKQVVIYCGENDLAASDTVTGPMVFHRFRQLFGMIREKFPWVHIAYVSMKPSPSRMHLLEKMREGNRLIREFLAKKKRTAFIDVHPVMMNETGRPLPHIFLSDSLHMNRQGYLLWQKRIEPYLLNSKNKD